MAELRSLKDQPMAQGTSEGRVEIFDPPLCCPTGLCGPTVDKTLLDVNEMVLALKERGLDVRRYQISAQPYAFTSNPQVYQLLRERQMAALPITVVNGRIIKVGVYPTLSEVEDALNARRK